MSASASSAACNYFEVEGKAARAHIVHALQPAAVLQKVKAELRFSEKRYAKWPDFVGMVIEYTRA